MACNNLGLFSFNGSSPVGLCELTPDTTLWGDSITVGNPLYSNSPCSPSELIFTDGYYSDGSVVFQYDGGIQQILSISACTTPTPTPTSTLPECICTYITINISQQDLDSASGNTNPSLDGVVFYGYTDCADPNPPAYSQYTSSGTYKNDVCCLTNQVAYTYFYFYQNDVLYDSIINPLLFTSTYETNGCCTVVPTPTPTPTMSTPTPTPTKPCYCATLTYTGSVTPSVLQYTDCSGNLQTTNIAPNIPFSICTDGGVITVITDPASILYLNGISSCTNGVDCDSPSPTLTPTPTLTSTEFIYSYYLSGCCGNQNIQINSTTTLPLVIGEVNYIVWDGNTKNACFTVVGVQIGWDNYTWNTLNDTIMLSPDCTTCLFDYELICPTPTPTPTETEGLTPTPTPTLTPTPTETACSICVCWVLEYTGSVSPVLIRYTDCSNNNADYYATPNVPFSICACDGTNIYVIDDPSTTLQTISIGLCSDGINCDEPPSTPTPTPTPTPTLTPTQTETNTPTPTPTSTQTSTPTPTITPTSTSTTCFTEYCISNTGESTWDDQYVLTGTYNSRDYWVGTVNGLFIYYDTINSQWCLSDSLGGTCYLAGKSPCSSLCPDLCSDYFTIGFCPTPTPTPTGPCNINYDIVFGCETDTTPTPTPTPTITSTPTLTPTPTDICASVSVDATITSTTPTPTPTKTLTPTPTAPVTRPYNLTGNVAFNTLDSVMVCPLSKQFQDCYNGTMYYTTGSITTPSGDTLEQFMVFEALVDGTSRCISYVGENTDIIGINTIVLRNGPYGYSNLGECINCNTFVTPTPTPTNTQTPTPTLTPTRTLTPTPSSGSVQTYYVFKKCEAVNTYLIQTQPASINTPGTTFYNNGDLSCWTFMNQYTGAVPLNPSFNIINYSGNYFTSVGQQTYGKCGECVSAQTTTTTTTTKPNVSCRIPYSHYKTDGCARTLGTIKVNNVIVYSFGVGLGVGSYSGFINVTTGDVIEFNFATSAPSAGCLNTVSTVELGISPLNLNYSATQYSGNQEISETFTITSAWCNPQTQIVIQSYSTPI